VAKWVPPGRVKLSLSVRRRRRRRFDRDNVLQLEDASLSEEEDTRAGGGVYSP
jgi:hypothetical protein